MKKVLVVIGAMGLLCMMASPLMAGGIINKSNLSSDYFRSLTRNAATDAADIVAYNPAGVMKMPNGLYIKGDAMYITKDYENKVPDQTAFPTNFFSGEDGDFESDVPSIVPGFFSVYKQDKWAGFFAVTIPGGGGEVKWEDGSAYTSLLAMGIWGDAGGPLGPYSGLDSAEIEANSFAIGYTLGGAYEINNMFSVAGGIRYVNARQEFKGQVDLTEPVPTPFPDVYEIKLDRTATGFSYFLGLNVAPTDKLNIGFQYMSNTNLDFESNVDKDTTGGSITDDIGWADGTSRREDLPGVLFLGASYQFTPNVRAELNYTLYLESAAELDSKAGRFDHAGNSSDLAASIEYIFNPQWKASLGYMITNIEGMDPEDLIPLAPELDATTIGVGAVYAPNTRWRFNLGYTDVTYDSKTTSVTGSNSPAGTELGKHSTAISVGVQYRFF